MSSNPVVPSQDEVRVYVSDAGYVVIHSVGGKNSPDKFDQHICILPQFAKALADAIIEAADPDFVEVVYPGPKLAHA